MSKPKEKQLRYIAYLRKSEERKERQVLSVESQRAEIEKRFPGLNIVEWAEETRSAFTPYNRPVFDRMMKRIHDKEADGIVSWYPNRLSRNEIEAANITYGIRTGEIKDLKFCTYTFENNPPGIWMLQMLLSHGQLESAKQGVDVSRGMIAKAKGGERPGQVPQGYIKVPKMDNNGNPIMNKFDRVVTETANDPDRYDQIKLMWKMLLYEGYNAEQIWKKVNNEWGFLTRKTTFKQNSPGGKPMPKSMVYAIFNNQFYAGLIKHNGEWHEGHHNAMITSNEYDYAQKLLGAKGKPRKTAHNFAYGTLIRCGVCNCQIVAKATSKHIKSTNELKTYVHYYCTRKSQIRPCTQVKYTTVDGLEKDIDAELAKYTIIPEFQEMALKILRRNNKNEVEDRTTLYESHQGRRKQIQLQLDKLTDKLTRGIVDEDDYVRQRDNLKANLADIDNNLRSTEKRAEDWMELTEKAFDFATYARIRFSETKDPMVKRDILQTLGANFLLTDNSLTLTPKKWLVPIERDYPALEKAYLKVRTNKKATAKELEVALSSIFDSWRARRDLNPRHPA